MGPLHLRVVSGIEVITSRDDHLGRDRLYAADVLACLQRALARPMCCSKVDQLHKWVIRIMGRVRANQNVVKFEISMYHVLLVHVIDGKCHLLEDALRPFFAELAMLCHQVTELTALGHLHDNHLVVHALKVNRLDQLHYVFMLADMFMHVNLGVQSIKITGEDVFHRPRLSCFVLALVHSAICTRAQEIVCIIGIAVTKGFHGPHSHEGWGPVLPCALGALAGGSCDCQTCKCSHSHRYRFVGRRLRNLRYCPGGQALLEV
mmetsp:Transcript_108655/g.306256  ORF Transcript_108655/g.306256 Transcript_108655/m.306256 type:complete len:262 (-) Transcript_108655:152-937(-)